MSRPTRGVDLLLVLSACASLACTAEAPSDDRLDAGAAAPSEVRLVDASGAEVVLARPARRVVSLVPSATETLRAMGADAVLVGRTDFDDQPWAARLPSVGGGIGPDIEAVVALEPDLVVRFAGEQDPRTPPRLDALGIPHLAVRPDRIEDIYRTAELLGRATGFEAASDSLVAATRAGLAAVARSVRGLERLRVAYVLGGTPPWVAGPGTYIDEVVALAGGDNVFADLGALYSAVSPEELRSREIDVVLLSEGASYDRALTPNTRIERVGEELEIPGPDVVDAAHEVALLLHGRSEP
ncbi:MAG TPA: helical backbone metal receptor [Longimicrobiales bacterium]|nr:helical backbone metal receptor [Longimicrobiales bacterium]